MTISRAIIDELMRAAANDQRVVLATVVRITGSSYGGVGSRMIIRPDGSTIGIVSGGCLEADLAEHARKVSESGQAKVVTYDTRADDDAAWGLGLGCNGLIDVLLEPLEGFAAHELADLLQEARNGKEPAVLATVIGARETSDPVAGSHLLVMNDGARATGRWPRGLHDVVVKDSRDAAAEKRRGMIREYDGLSVAFEVVTPAVRLVVCGSGPDVVPLVRSGVELGWNITVVDHRAMELAHPDRFPGARVVECMDPSKLAESTLLTSHTAAVVMSHHYARDMEYMKALLASDVAYIGMLGPRARTDRMLADIAAGSEAGVGVDLLRPHLLRSQRLYSPIGLDIGGDGPDAIALAILSEVSAVMTGSSGDHLRDRRGALHPPGTIEAGNR
jgi:xanthine/CO dehydrogenase XdhC/CoxF family maturation factor